ncbi:MAG: SBBP repeat-containing protein [Acidobacteria bacterium]|nr:SBBP repeat-containing protein [Acidobacteriota bacterium]
MKFVSHGKKSSLFLTSNSAVLSLLRGGQRLVLETRFPGANPNPRMEGAERLSGTVNYYLGADAAKWRTGVPRYGRVLYRGIYPGIDLAYYGTDRQLEYDFMVAPGADPRVIRMELSGQDAARIDARGDLVLLAGGSELRQHKPVVYQEVNGKRRPVDGRYVLRGRTVSFEVGPYDLKRTLIIDPLLGYSSYLGGNNEEDAAAVATDPACNVYMTGSTLSTDFPVSSGTFAAPRGNGSSKVVHVTKIEPDGESLVYSAFLGVGSSTGLAVDAAGNAYVTGVPGSDFPNTYDPVGGTNAAAFLAKLSPDGGKLIYSAILRNAAPRGIAIDRSGAAYIAGTTGKLLRTTAGVLQPSYPGTSSSTGFVAKLNPDGNSFGYITFFGGPSSSQTVAINAIAADSSGNAYITGSSGAADLPVTASAPQPRLSAGVDAFVFKLNASGSAVLFGTYLGGTGADTGFGIGLDGSNNLYAAGWTSSGAFPTTSGAYLTTVAGYGGAGWVVKYGPDYKLLYSTYIADVNGLRGLAVDTAGNAYTAGEASFTSTLRTTSDAVKAKVDRNADGADAWVAKIDPSGSRLLYGSYFGGSKDETVAGIAVDADASIYIAGETFSTDVPVSFNPVQKTHDPNVKYRDSYVTQFVERPWFDAEHVANGASSRGGAVAPGEIITIYGFSLGPKVLKTYNITAGKFDSLLGRAKVTFDGVAAPVIYANWGQTSVVVPYSVAGKGTTQVVVEYKGRPSAPVALQVVAAVPGVFTVPPGGTGQGAILLEDYSVNSPGNPVARGRAAMVFTTVGGESGQDGVLAAGISQHPLAVTATIGGKDATVIYAGPSPGLIWGLTQVNVIVPDSAPSGSAVPIVITVGGSSTQSGVTIAVK